MLSQLFRPHTNTAALLLRLGAAAIVVLHGVLKLAQDGGQAWIQTEIINSDIQVAVAWGEIVCGGALALGLLSRLAALGIIVIQAGAIYLVTGAEFVPSEMTSRGFNFQRPGYEYNVAIIIMCAAIMLLGSGKVAIDHLLFGSTKEG